MATVPRTRTYSPAVAPTSFFIGKLRHCRDNLRIPATTARPRLLRPFFDFSKVVRPWTDQNELGCTRYCQTGRRGGTGRRGPGFHLFSRQAAVGRAEGGRP